MNEVEYFKISLKIKMTLKLRGAEPDRYDHRPKDDTHILSSTFGGISNDVYCYVYRSVN